MAGAEKNGNAAKNVSRGLPPWMIAIGLFMTAVLGVNAAFVWVSARGHRDLVRENYYEAGLKQDSIIALTEAAGRFELRREGSDWVVENAVGPAGPAGFADPAGSAGVPGTAGAATGCRLRFYRPDDGRADAEIRLTRAPAPEGREAWRGSARPLRRGAWIVTAVWDREGRDIREATLALHEP